MANTRSSTKRSLQAERRRARNQANRSVAKTILRDAVEAIKQKDLEKARETYRLAVQALSKAASKGALPKQRAARKISRLTHFAKKALPQFLADRK